METAAEQAKPSITEVKEEVRTLAGALAGALSDTLADPLAANPLASPIVFRGLNEILEQHGDWLDSNGAAGIQADFSRENLEHADLIGTVFHQANLQAATLDGATGLLNRQLAGSNLFGAVLPADTSPSEGLKFVRAVASKAGWFLVATLLINALAWMRIFTTRDPQLLRNAPAFPFFGLQADVPFVPFYLFGPVVILSLYVSFHLYLQRLC